MVAEGGRGRSSREQRSQNPWDLLLGRGKDPQVLQRTREQEGVELPYKPARPGGICPSPSRPSVLTRPCSGDMAAVHDSVSGASWPSLGTSPSSAPVGCGREVAPRWEATGRAHSNLCPCALKEESGCSGPQKDKGPPESANTIVWWGVETKDAGPLLLHQWGRGLGVSHLLAAPPNSLAGFG